MKKVLTLIVMIFLSCAPVYIAEKAFEQKDYSNTVQLCRKSLKTDPANADAYHLMAKAFLELGQIDSAQIAWEKAARLIPASMEFKQSLSRINIIKGDNLVQQKKYRLSIVEYDKAAEHYPTLAVFEKIGDTYYTWGKYDQALASFQKAEELPGDHLNIKIKIDQIKQAELESERYLTEGMKVMKTGEFTKAVELLAQAAKYKPDNIEAQYQHHMVKGFLLHQKGSLNDMWDAIVEYGLAATLKPERAEPHYYMGLAYDRKDRKEIENAISEYELAIQKEPNGPYAEIAQKKIQDCIARKNKIKTNP